MTTGMRSLGRLEWQALLLLALAFAGGGLVGVSLDRLWLRSGPPPHGPPRAGGLPAPLDQLDLSATQRDQIHAILERNRPRTDSVMAELMPRLRGITDQVEAEIRAALTDAQRAEYDRLQPRSGPRPNFAPPDPGPMGGPPPMGGPGHGPGDRRPPPGGPPDRPPPPR